MQQPAPAILLFDGVCNLCNGVVQFIIKRDTKGKFKFASLQSDIGQQYLQHYGLPVNEVKTIVLIEDDQAFTLSTAALKIAPHLGGFWFLLKIAWLIPAFLRNLVYRFIARNRYKWFGRQEQCMLPRSEWKDRFL